MGEVYRATALAPFRTVEVVVDLRPMALKVGSHLGNYEILAPIGAGGMGEVYRARHSKLKREVAIKVLPEAFARDAERKKRFER